jgi:hypothetical protein
VKPHNRNLSVHQQSTLHDSAANIQSNMRKLEPLSYQTISETKRESIDPQAVKLVANLLNNEKG